MRYSGDVGRINLLSGTGFPIYLLIFCACSSERKADYANRVRILAETGYIHFALIFSRKGMNPFLASPDNLTK